VSVQSIRRARSVLSCGSSAAATFGGIASRLASFVPSGVAYLLVQFGGLRQLGQRLDGHRQEGTPCTRKQLQRNTHAAF